jgi:hypothetical protein
LEELDDIVVTGASGVEPPEAVVAAATGAESTAAAEGDDDDGAEEREEQADAAGDNGADAAAGSTDDADKAASDAGKTLAGKKHSLQKRIDQFRKGEAEAIRARDAERTRRESVERELEALRAGKTAVKPGEQTPAAPAAAALTSATPQDKDPEPSLTDYSGEDGKTYEQWIADRADWAARKVTRERDAVESARVERDSAQRAQEQAVANLTERTEAFRATHPDFDTVLDASEAVTTDLMTRFIQNSELGPELAYHLAQHAEESLRIANLAVPEALIALGRLEGRLTPAEAVQKTGPAPKAHVTRAPLPPKPVGARAATVVPDDDLDTDDWIERRNAQEAEARRRR